jgi:hypothetical protein
MSTMASELKGAATKGTGSRPRRPETVRAALRLREQGASLEAIALLADEGNEADAEVRSLLAKLQFEAHRYADLQTTLESDIDRRVAEPDRDDDTEHLLLLMRLGQRACLAMERLEGLAEATARASRGRPELLTAWRALVHRQKFRRTMAERYVGHAPIISLGLHCLPWHVPSLWGLRSRDEFVSHFNPFALGAHRLEGLAAILETDFDGYADPSETMIVETANGHRVPMRKDRAAAWNHHRSNYWLLDDAAALRADLAVKAENFRRSCKSPGAVFLIAKADVEYPEEALDFLPKEIGSSSAIKRRTIANRDPMPWMSLPNSSTVGTRDQTTSGMMIRSRTLRRA